MSAKDWLIRTIPLFLVLNMLFGWHGWTDHTYLELIFVGMLIGLFEGGFLLEGVKERQSQNTLLLERLEEGQRENTLLLEQLEEGQRRVEAEQQKLKRQQVRATILIEGIMANMPAASDNMPSDDCGTP